jgi:hypothetical protein
MTNTTMQNAIFCGYLAFLAETEKNPQMRDDKIVKAAIEYLMGQGFDFPDDKIVNETLRLEWGLEPLTLEKTT